MRQVSEMLRRRLRRSGDDPSPGATLVEYALIASLVVVGSLAAIQNLDDRSREETDRQVDCVAERPPRASCQIPAIVTTTVAEPPTTPTSTGEPTIGPSEVAVSETTAEDLGDGNWSASVTYLLTEAESDDIPGAPIEGATISVTWTVSGSPPVLGSCTTGADGTCTISFVPTELNPSAVSVRVDVNNVFGADPPPESYGSSEVISAP